MPTNTQVDALLGELAKAGYEGRIVCIQHVVELQEQIASQVKGNLFDEEFYQLRLTFFNFKPVDALPNAKSIIVVAVPRPQAQAEFNFQGRKKTVLLPPTYVGYQKIMNSVTQFVGDKLKEKGYKIAKTTLPLKLLAVRSGLCEYGRNNITYVRGMGSFFEIVALYSDMPCDADSWREPQAMKECEKCQACQRACPTGAISSDRFLLHGERCLAYHNEKKGNVPFPVWIDPAWHNSLYGCILCQRACPLNRRFLDWFGEKEEFSQKETELLMRKTSVSELPDLVLQKLKNLDLDDKDSLDNLPRNLQVLFNF